MDYDIKPKITDIQSLAEFFGWDREKAIKVKQSISDIAPNGVRRDRRINNDFIPDDEDSIVILQREINRENKVNKITEDNTNV